VEVIEALRVAKIEAELAWNAAEVLRFEARP